MTVTVHAPAKINLTLDVVGRRADGYHELESIMQSVDWYDTLTVTTAPSGIVLEGSGCSVCPPQKNTATRAAQEFFRYTGLSGGVHIRLDKHIPQQAGMGGGSTDAAAVLLALDRLYGTGLSLPKLYDIGARVGADVPFCIRGGTAFVTGIGEQVQSIPALQPCFIVIAQPAQGISTAAAYAALDAATPPARPDHAVALKCIAQGNLAGVCRQMINVFEAATALSGVTEIRRAMDTFHPLASQMTGSGSAVFAVFDDETIAADCAATLAKTWPVAAVCRPCTGCYFE